MTDSDRAEIDGINVELSDIEAELDRLKADSDSYLDKVMVHEPLHYQNGCFETVDKIMFVLANLGLDAFTSYCVGNAIKYIDRAGRKAVNGSLDKGLEMDCKKAANYLHMAIQGEWSR